MTVITRGYQLHGVMSFPIRRAELHASTKAYFPGGENMTTRYLPPALAAVPYAAAPTFAAPSMAATVNMKADMKASSEVPVNDSKGTGVVTATYDTATKKLTWKGTYSGLTGPATAAHFHAGEPGKNGAIVIPVFQGGEAKSPFEGSAVLTDAQASDLLAGRWYFNIHTAANKGGEIRGQVTK
jgi:CHRD domain-containing protein